MLMFWKPSSIAAQVNVLHGQQNYQGELLKPQRWLGV